MVRWVVGLIIHGGPIELFLIPASMCYPVCGMMHIQEPYKRVAYVVAAGFLSRYLSGPFYHMPDAI